jgi:hypothetical protein
MTYLLQTNRKKRGNVTFLKPVLVGLCAVLLVFLLRAPLVSLGVQTARPFALARESGIGLWFSSKQALISEITALKEQNQKLLLTREVLPEDDVEFGTTSPKYIVGSVVVAMGGSPFDTIKVKTSEPVILGKKVKAQDMYIGEVSEVSGTVAFIKLYSTPGSVLKGFFGTRHIPIEAEGLGGGAFKILVPKGMDARVGDAFLLGEEKHLIAVSQRVFESPEETFLLVEAALPVNPFEIKDVFIEK